MADIARHVIDTHFEPSFLELHGIHDVIQLILSLRLHVIQHILSPRLLVDRRVLSPRFHDIQRILIPRCVCVTWHPVTRRAMYARLYARGTHESSFARITIALR